MRVAPPVQALSSGTGPWRWIQQALYGLSAAVLIAWVAGHWFDVGLTAGLASAGAGLAAAWLANPGLSARPSQLQWDGSAWLLLAPTGQRESGRATLMLDLVGWMLVRFMPASRSAPWAASWLPLRRRDAGTDWNALRVALYAADAAVLAADAPRRPHAAARAPADP